MQSEAEQVAQFKKLVSSYAWRIQNLYKIKSTDGKAITFAPNWAQRNFIDNAHYFNVILKARQLGFSTYIDIHGLDRCLFFANQSFGIIAQGEKEAQGLLANCRFAYENLPQWLRDEVRLTKDNTETLEFSNGSKIVADISLRSGTYQVLHVSEFGKTSAKFPEKAKEIKTGAFNTVHLGNQIFVESTAEGQGGEFFNLVKHARELQDAGKELGMLDPKFHFYPWYKNPNYALSDNEARRVALDTEMFEYFDKLKEEHGLDFTPEQKAWYAKKAKSMGEDMRREFPTTPDESFAASVEGAIYARQMRILREQKQITRVPYEPNALVHTFWDFGSANYMAIWFFQQVGRERRFIRYYQHSGKDFRDYIDYMRKQPYLYGDHFVPHDGNTTRLMETGNKTYKQVMEGLGLTNIKVVPVTKSKWQDIEFVCKPALLAVWMDEVNCSEGIKCLDNYKKEKNKDGIWLNEPKHDEFSDGADAFRTYAVGYRERVKTAPASFRLGEGERAV